MSVRAKFKVTRIEVQSGSMLRRNEDGSFATNENGGQVYDKVEQRTVVMHPVYSNDPNSENAKFWSATPAGEIRLGTVNPAAWQMFEIDGEYYADFTKAE